MYLNLFGGLMVLVVFFGTVSILWYHKKSERNIEADLFDVILHKNKITNYSIWRNIVLHRDGYRCVYCGSTENLEAHHLLPKAEFRDHRYLVKNGVTVCRQCHLTVAAIYRNMKKVAHIIPQNTYVDIDLINTDLALFVSGNGRSSNAPVDENGVKESGVTEYRGLSKKDRKIARLFKQTSPVITLKEIGNRVGITESGVCKAVKRLGLVR